MAIYEKLMNIQGALVAPKNQKNTFGNYNYRSCEDILEALKPLLRENKTTLIITDEVINIGTRFYVRALAKVIDIETGESVEVSALAREDETKKGMDLAQITGSVSSYARKYALNGLFCIDDTKDPDSSNRHGKEDLDKRKNETGVTAKQLSEKQVKRFYAIARGIGSDTKKANRALELKYGLTDPYQLTKVQYDEVCKAMESRKKETKVPTNAEVDAAIDEDVPF